MESVGTVNFEDLFDFSPEPLEDSNDTLDLGQLDRLIVKQQALINQTEQSNRSNAGSHLSSPLAAESYGVSPQDNSSASSGTKGRRGRKPSQKVLKSDMKTKLERSRQSARECRARKKLRYQYLDDLLLEREKANIKLKEELLVYQKWCHELDKGRMPEQLPALLKSFAEELQQKN